VEEDLSGQSLLDDTNVYGMDCFGDLALALFDKHILYIGSGIIGDIIGTGDPGFKNGVPNAAQFNQPRDVATLGNSIFVADSGNNAIRQVHFFDLGFNDRRYFVSTVIQDLDSSPLSVTTDEIGNIYYLLRDGVYRLPLDTNRASKILTRRNIDENSKLRWDGAAALVLADTGANQIFRIAPTKTDLNAAWDVEVIAGNGKVGNPNPGGIATKLPVEKPIALSVDESGTLWYASFEANQISRIDRIRK
jgi:sugar lactone lactonase YvrE